MKVVKFGGSSVASAAQFKKVAQIMQQDPARQVMVVSACGKDANHLVKVTDMLTAITAGQDEAENFAAIQARFQQLAKALHLELPLSDWFAEIKTRWQAEKQPAYLISRGEFLTAKLMAAYLNRPFLDAKDLLFFDGSQLDQAKSAKAVQNAFAQHPYFVLPGFYGSDETGGVHLMPRGGSDITGAYLANFLDASLYENWTDVSGILMADPRIVPDAQPIAALTYSELRELTFMGAGVFQEEAVLPVREKAIPTCIKNTNDPQAPGTLIVRSDQLQSERLVTGIAGRRHYTVITLKKYGLGAHLEIIQAALATLARFDLKVAYMPTAVDALSLIFHGQLSAIRLRALTAALDHACQPDDIDVQANIALIATISQQLKKRPAIAGQLLAYLDDNLIQVQLVSQAFGDICLLIGVAKKDYARTIRAIYQNFMDVKENQVPAPYFEIS